MGNRINGQTFYGTRINDVQNSDQKETAVKSDQTIQSDSYPGGRLEIDIYKSDTQKTFMMRGLYKHAEKAGLSEEERIAFAEKWAGSTLYHQANGKTVPYSAKEFAELKAKGKADFDLDAEYSPAALKDLRQRQAEYISRQAQTNSNNSFNSISAPNVNEQESAVKSITDIITSVTGTESEVGKQLNRAAVSTLRLMGNLQEMQNKVTGGITQAVRDIAPDSVDNFLDRFDNIQNQRALALKNARSQVTAQDTEDDLRNAALGKRPSFESDLARKAMYFPEAIPNAIDSAIKGDFKDDDGSYSDQVGKIIGGMNPAGDVRDVIANIKNVADGKNGAWIGLGAAMVGMIPIIGDGGKIVLKAEKEVIAETVEKLVKQGIEKEAAEKTAKAEVERLVKEAVEKQYDEIAKTGHSVQRHGTEVTERQLDERAMYGKDPITGTTDDAYSKFPDGTPKPHKSGKDATKFVSKEALVKAESYIKTTQEYKDALNNAVINPNLQRFEVNNVKLEDVFGADYKNQVFGKTRIGTKNKPIGTNQTDFTDGKITAVFQKDASGNWSLFTMFPTPKN